MIDCKKVAELVSKDEVQALGFLKKMNSTKIMTPKIAIPNKRISWTTNSFMSLPIKGAPAR